MQVLKPIQTLHPKALKYVDPLVLKCALFAIFSNKMAGNSNLSFSFDIPVTSAFKC